MHPETKQEERAKVTNHQNVPLLNNSYFHTKYVLWISKSILRFILPFIDFEQQSLNVKQIETLH